MTKKPDNTEINRNTGAHVFRLVRVHGGAAEGVSDAALEAIGFLMRRALRSAVRATIIGEQPDSVIEAQIDKAQQAFNRYLTRSVT